MIDIRKTMTNRIDQCQGRTGGAQADPTDAADVLSWTLTPQGFDLEIR